MKGSLGGEMPCGFWALEPSSPPEMAFWLGAGACVAAAPGGGSRFPRRPQPLNPRATSAMAAHLLRVWVDKPNLRVAPTIEAKSALREHPRKACFPLPLVGRGRGGGCEAFHHWRA